MLVSVWGPFQVCVNVSYRSLAGPGPLQDFPASGPWLLRSKVADTVWMFGCPATQANATLPPRDMSATSPAMAASFFFTDYHPHVMSDSSEAPRSPPPRWTHAADRSIPLRCRLAQQKLVNRKAAEAAPIARIGALGPALSPRGARRGC